MENGHPFKSGGRRFDSACAHLDVSSACVLFFCVILTVEMALAKYNKKRNFKATPEPKGKIIKSKKLPIFVIQKHAARALHYDFRLEIDGVLKSWAVPKGPSKDPSVRRLAMMTEDHPIAYATFSGTIPKGNYGAGKVEIWDKGTFRPIKKPKMNSRDVKSGLLEFELNGKKVKGDWVLFAIGKDKKAWILKKMK